MEPTKLRGCLAAQTPENAAKGGIGPETCALCHLAYRLLEQ
jgi:hypothetical protein